MDFMIEKTQISLCEVIADVARSAERLAEVKGVHIKISQFENCCSMAGDYGRLRQMFMIILDNAIKFSPDNGSVEISLYNTQVTIRDTGPGVAAEHLPYLFDRFYKARTEDNKTGTGLGLAIAKQIADRHEIRLTAQNDENGGAIFIFDLSQNQKI
jgi:signal transduction histidine kinase